MPPEETAGPPGPSIDWMVLADYAEAYNGKVTLVGGGFDRVMVADFSQPHRTYLAAGLKVPWEDTNRRIPLTGQLETGDGEALPWSLAGELEAGRPPGLRGQSAWINIALPVDIAVAGPTSVVLTLTFGNHSRRSNIALQHPGPTAAV